MSDDQKLSATEEKALRRFEAEHACIKAPFWRRQPPRRVTAVQQAPNGIAPAFHARCACGAVVDITDYGSW